MECVWGSEYVVQTPMVRTCLDAEVCSCRGAVEVAPGMRAICVMMGRRPCPKWLGPLLPLAIDVWSIEITKDAARHAFWQRDESKKSPFLAVRAIKAH
jgi:hypothetical protein